MTKTIFRDGIDSKDTITQEGFTVLDTDDKLPSNLDPTLGKLLSSGDAGIINSYLETTDANNLSVSSFAVTTAGATNNPPVGPAHFITSGSSSSGFRLVGSPIVDGFYIQSFLSGSFNNYHEVVHADNIADIVIDEGTF